MAADPFKGAVPAWVPAYWVVKSPRFTTSAKESEHNVVRNDNTMCRGQTEARIFVYIRQDYIVEAWICDNPDETEGRRTKEVSTRHRLKAASASGGPDCPVDPIKSPVGWMLTKGRQCVKGKGEEKTNLNDQSGSQSPRLQRQSAHK